MTTEERKAPPEYASDNQATTAAAVKLQSFVRGCMCRGMVERVVATLIEEMMRTGESSKISVTSMLESSHATLGTADTGDNQSSAITTSEYTDHTNRSDDDNADADADLIDGIQYPKSLPSNFFDQSFSSAVSLGVDEVVQSNSSSPVIMAKQGSVRDRIGLIQKGNSSSGIKSFGNSDKRSSVVSVGSMENSLKEQLGMSQGTLLNKSDSSIYSVPYLKSMSAQSSSGRPPRRMPRSSPRQGLDNSNHSLGDDAILLSSEDRETSRLSRTRQDTKLGSSMHTFLSPDNFADEHQADKPSSVRDLISRGEEGWNKKSFDKTSLHQDSESSVLPSETIPSFGSVHSIKSKFSAASQIKSSDSVSSKTKSALQEKMAAFEKNHGTSSSSSFHKKGASEFGSKTPQRNKSAPSGSSGLPPTVPMQPWKKPTKTEMRFTGNSELNEVKTTAETEASSAVMVAVANDVVHPQLSIAERIAQLRAASKEYNQMPAESGSQAEKLISKENEVRRVDFATRLYMMESSAAKIQALARGYIYRKKNKEATVNVVNWLKQHKLLDADGPASSLEISDEMREKAVEALAAEIEHIDPSESHHDSDPSENSSEQNQDRSTAPMVLSFSQRKKAYEKKLEPGPVVKARKLESNSITNEALAPLTERKKAFEQSQDETSVPTDDPTVEAVPLKDQTRKVLAMMNKKQHEAATKIQALARGFIERKFDVKSMMVVVQWVKEHQDSVLPYDPDDYEPETNVLENVWSFLESNNTWTKDKEVAAREKRAAKADDDVSIDIVEENTAKINVQELLNTWEWLLSDELKKQSTKSVVEDKENLDPTSEELQSLQTWIDNNQVLVGNDGELGVSGKKGKTQPVRIMRTKNGIRAINMETLKVGSEERNVRQASDSATIHSDVSKEITAIKSQGDKIATLSEKFGGTGSRESIVARDRDTHGSLADCKKDSKDSKQPNGAERIVTSGVECRFPASGGGVISAADAMLEPTKARNTQDLVDLWKFLVSHGMDMNAVRRYEVGVEGTVDRTKTPHRIKNSSIVGSKEPYNFHPTHDEAQRQYDGVRYVDDEDVDSAVREDIKGMQAVNEKKAAYESHLAKKSETKKRRTYRLPTISNDSGQSPQYSRHKTHDEMYGRKGDGVLYINDDLLNSHTDLDEENCSQQTYGRHKMHDEMYGSKGDGVVYIDDDLSGSYTDLGEPSGTSRVGNSRRDGFGSHKMHDEAYDSKSDGVQYIDEDLSASYTSLTNLSKTNEEKPTLKEMVNYWAFSNHHYLAASQEQRLDESSDAHLDVQNKNSGQDPTSKQDWRESAAKNDFIGTLAWLQSKGIELNEVTRASPPKDKMVNDKSQSEENSDNETQKKDHMTDSLKWLQSNGYGKRSSVRGSSFADETQSVDRESDNEDISSRSDESENAEQSNFVSDYVLPKKAEMSDTLKWLISKGYRTPARKKSQTDSREGGDQEMTTPSDDSTALESEIEGISEMKSFPRSSEVSGALAWLESQEERSETSQKDDEVELSKHATANGSDFSNVLQSLSWLKKNGFKLDKPSRMEEPESNWSPDSAPSRKQVLQALEALDDDIPPVETNAEMIAKIDNKPKEVKSRRKKDENMERTLAWLTQRGMKLPKKAKRKMKQTDNSSPGSEKAKQNEVVSVFSKQVKSIRFDASPTHYDVLAETSDSPQGDPPRKIKARMTKVPNKKKKATSPLLHEASDDLSPALKWLQSKRGIPLDSSKSKSSTLDASLSRSSDSKEGSFSNGNATKSKSKRKSKARTAVPDEVTAEELKATMDNVFKLSTHVRGSSSKMPPSSRDMEQALSWLKLRESRRQAQAAASNLTPTSPTSVETEQAVQKKAQVRVRQSKGSTDGAEVVSEAKENRIGEEGDQIGHAVTNDEIESSSRPGRKKKKSKEDVSKARTKSRSHSREKKKERDKSSESRPSKGDMTKALMFLQQSRGTTKNTIVDSQDAHSDEELDSFKLVAPAYTSFTPTKPSNQTDSPRKKPKSEKTDEIPEQKKKESNETTATGGLSPTPKSQEERDYVNALNFLSGFPVEAVEDEPYFAKLDSMLPRKSTQTNETRAKEIAKALKWIKKQGVSLSGSTRSKAPTSDSSFESPKKSQTKSVAQETVKSPKKTEDAESTELRPSKPDVSTEPSAAEAIDPKIAESEDFKNCVQWLSGRNRDSIKDSRHFQKLDTMLPKRSHQSTEERARDMVKALQWVKKSSAKKAAGASGGTAQDSEKNEKNTTVRNTSKSPGRRGSKSPSTRSKPKLTVRKGKGKQSSGSAPSLFDDLTDDDDTKNALRWIKNQDRETLEDAAAFKKLDSVLPKRAGQTPEERAIEMSKALKLTKMDDGGNSPTPSKDEIMKSLAPEEQQAYSFLVAKSEGSDYMSLEAAAVFKRVDNMMPTNKDQALDERAKQMVKMIGWLKKKGKI